MRNRRTEIMKKITEFVAKHRGSVNVLVIASGIILFCTVYTLILPAAAVSGNGYDLSKDGIVLNEETADIPALIAEAEGMKEETGLPEEGGTEEEGSGETESTNEDRADAALSFDAPTTDEDGQTEDQDSSDDGENEAPNDETVSGNAEEGNDSGESVSANTETGTGAGAPADVLGDTTVPSIKEAIPDGAEGVVVGEIVSEAEAVTPSDVVTTIQVPSGEQQQVLSFDSSLSGNESTEKPLEDSSVSENSQDAERSEEPAAEAVSDNSLESEVWEIAEAESDIVAEAPVVYAHFLSADVNGVHFEVGAEDSAMLPETTKMFVTEAPADQYDLSSLGNLVYGRVFTVRFITETAAEDGSLSVSDVIPADNVQVTISTDAPALGELDTKVALDLDRNGAYVLQESADSEFIFTAGQISTVGLFVVDGEPEVEELPVFAHELTAEVSGMTVKVEAADAAMIPEKAMLVVEETAADAYASILSSVTNVKVSHFLRFSIQNEIVAEDGAVTTETILPASVVTVTVTVPDEIRGGYKKIALNPTDGSEYVLGESDANTFTFETTALDAVVLIAKSELAEKLTASVDGGEVVLEAGEDAGIPENAVLSVEEIAVGSTEYNALRNDAASKGKVGFARFFRLSLKDANGNDVIPAAPVTVRFELGQNSNADAGFRAVLDMDNQAKRLSRREAEIFAYETANFGTVGAVAYDFLKLLHEVENDYSVTMYYNRNSGVPDGASLSVRELDPESDEYKEYRAMLVEALGGEAAVKTERLFDITLLKDGQEIEPTGYVNVEINLADKATVEGDEIKVVHFKEEKAEADSVGAASAKSQEEAVKTPVEIEKVEATEKDDQSVEVKFESDQFSIYGVVGMELKKEITLATPDGDDVTYVVTVTYGENAQIPKDAYLDITEYGALDDKYVEAWDAVVEAKKNAHEVFDENSLGLSALDISIKDAAGNAVEPAEGAEVKVSIQMKTLPENVEEKSLSETMEIQHLNESTGTIRVETVAKADDIKVENGSATAEFIIDSFSTFTITWSLPGSTVSDANASFRLRYQTPNQWTQNAYSQNVRVWYVDESGINIRKPNGRSDVTYNADNYPLVTMNLSDYTALSGYEFIEARYSANTTNKPAGQTIDSVQFVTSGNNRTANYIYNGETVASYTRDSTTNNDTGNVYLVYRSSNQREIKVHYGYMSEGEFVEFNTLPDGAQTNYGPPVGIGDQLNLRYDIEGKDFVTVRMGDPSSGTQISPLLQTSPRNANVDVPQSYSTYPYWRYRELNTLTVRDGINQWLMFPDHNEDLYVIYRDTPTEKSYDDGDIDPGDLSAPATNKAVDANHNGTYDVSLSVTGASNSVMNKTHANVVVVLDTSSSMDRTDIETTGQTIPGEKNRLDVAQEAINYLADELFGFNTAEDPAAIEVAFVTFSHRVRNEMTKDTLYSGPAGGVGYTQFKNLVANLYNSGGTNYDTAIEAANSVLWDDADPVYVIFITDGDTVSRGYLEYDAAGNRDHASDWDGGTYYTGDTATYGNTYLERARSAAKLQVDKILSDSNNRFYSIGVFGNVQYLPLLGGTYLGQANEQSKIEEAFASIIDEIAMNLGYEDVTIHDGITAMTATTLVNGTVDQFRYEITTKNGDVKQYANGAALQVDYPEIGLASYDAASKAVAWELGDDYQLEDGVTYKVIFTVWPSQASYDLLADLNNGIKDYDSLDPTVKSQIIIEKGKYYLKTNTYSTIDYTSIKKEDGVIVDTDRVEGAEIKDPNGKMILDGTMLEMEKLWNDTSDPAQLLELLTEYLNEDKTDTTYEVILRLWQDKGTSDEKEISTSEYPLPNGFIYKPNVTITDGKVTAATWPTIDVAISPGVLVQITEDNASLYPAEKYPRFTYGGVTYAMLEPGHQYIITEDNTDLHFELNTDVYHPMEVNGVLKTVKFSDDGKRITGMSPDDTGLSTLTATNDLKGGLEIHKIVTTKDDKSDKVTSDDAFFTFNIKLQKSETDATPVYTTSDQFENGSPILGSVGFRIFASKDIPVDATNVAEDKSSYEYDGKTFSANYDEGGAITGYTARGTIPSSGELNLKIRQSDVIRVVNLPAGTYYTVVETGSAIPSGYELLDKSNDRGTVPANTQALAEFWNKRTSFTIDLLKVDELDSEIVLEGAAFKLYESDGETPAKDADGNAIGTITTDADGKADIGKLLPGTYKLVETNPPEGYNQMTTPITIVVSTEKVTYQQGSKQPSDAVKSEDGLTWTVIATNNPGVKLPNTGGSGTLLYTLSGLALMLGAALLYGFRMKRSGGRLN